MRRRKLLLAHLTVAAVLLTQPSATLAIARVDPDTVALPGDTELGCEALTTEIDKAAAASPESKKRKKGLGLFRALAAASPLGTMVRGPAGSLAGSALSTMGSVAAQSPQRSDAGGASQPDRRVQWLRQIQAAKQC